METRWNSTYEMLDRFINLADKIGSILLHCPSAPPMLTSGELQTIKEFVTLLKPFEEATKMICGEKYLTASKVIPVVNTLHFKLENCKPASEIGERLKKLLIEEFSKRFKDVECVSLLAIATILDPRFKKLNFRNKIACSNAVAKIYRALKEVEIEQDIPNNNDSENKENVDKKNDFWAFHKNLASESVSR